MSNSVNVLAVGDICGPSGMDIIADKLRVVKKQFDIDFTVVNGENAAGLGIYPKQADEILAGGADVITLGNHTWNKSEIREYLDDNRYILRPANYAPQVPGAGWRVFDASFGKVCVINLLGRVDIKLECESPFLEIDKILKKNEAVVDRYGGRIEDCKVILVDFHASATSEKTVMAYHLDGKVSALWGTHTHVQTSDARVFPGGTGFITDIGMTGPYDSIIGMRIKEPLMNFRGNPPSRFISAEGPSRIEAAVFEIDRETGKCLSVEAIRVS